MCNVMTLFFVPYGEVWSVLIRYGDPIFLLISFPEPGIKVNLRSFPGISSAVSRRELAYNHQQTTTFSATVKTSTLRFPLYLALRSVLSW